MMEPPRGGALTLPASQLPWSLPQVLVRLGALFSLSLSSELHCLSRVCIVSVQVLFRITDLAFISLKSLQQCSTQGMHMPGILFTPRSRTSMQLSASALSEKTVLTEYIRMLGQGQGLNAGLITSTLLTSV